MQMCIKPICSASLEDATCARWTADAKQSARLEPAASGEASLTATQLLIFWLAASGTYAVMAVCILASFRRPPPGQQVKRRNSKENLEPMTPPTPSDEASPGGNAAKAAAAAKAATKLSRDTEVSNSPTGSLAGVAAVAADAAASAALVAAVAAAAAADSAFLGSRFLLRFRDDDLEASWVRWVLSTGHHRKKKLYIGTFVGLCILHAVELVEHARSPCADSMGSAVLRAFAKISLLVGMVCAVAVCWEQTDRWTQLRPSSSMSSASGDRRRRTLECLLIMFCFFYVPAQSFPPFAPWPCESPGAMPAMRQADYSLQGHTALQMQVLLILLASWLAPTFEMLYFVWCWLAVVHLGWTVFWRRTLATHPYGLLDISVRTLLLGAVSMIAIARRFQRERGERLRFLQDIQQRDSSKQVFRYLEYMMPGHVIGPMLKSPGLPIAEEVSRVSILFIMISGFDRLTQGMPPRRLLHFLNEQFVRIDQICVANGVAKIETVREEYVACAGVLPADRAEAARDGHSAVLARLVRAAGQILELQTRVVQFKMGMHTGPIVAGVIGQKLPRYRLFGDTMNFAARHMQMGVPGKLQFGEETRKELQPAVLLRVSRRGRVEMKGKGKVMAYLFEPEQRLSRLTTPELPTFTPRVSLAQSKTGDFNTRFESALLDVTATEEAQAKRWVLSEKEGFTPRMETSWLLWHNQHFVCKVLERWVGAWVILALLLSGADHSFAASEAGQWSHRYYDASWRLPVFVYGRGGALVLLLSLWYACDVYQSWFLDNPCMAQALAVLVCCIVALLLFLSSDALIFSNGPEYMAALAGVGSGRHAPQDHIFKLGFMLLFDSVTKALTPRFFHSVVFVGLAAAIVVAQLLLPGGGSWFSPQGHLLFVAAAVLNAVGSHQDEQDSRARYKSKCAVELTRARTEQLLDRLMPPLLVQALRALPPGAAPPSHEFRHATIAQSDLCGFTQLASQRSALEVVKFMGDLFGAFDDLTDLHQVYKVDTVGDAYIAGMAEEPLTAKNSPISVVSFALDVVTAVQAWAMDLGVSVNCRVGVHYGQCIGGIVGKSMQFKLGAESGYQLFGALLTGLEILESTSPEGRVQISRACREELEREMQCDTAAKECEAMTFEPRLEKHLTTSKGEMHDYSEVGGLSYLVQRKSPLSAAAEGLGSAWQSSSGASHSGIGGAWHCDSSVTTTSAASGHYAAACSQHTSSLPDLSALCGNTIREDEDEEGPEDSEQSEPDSMSEASFVSEASEPGESRPPSRRSWTPVMSREVLEPVFEPSALEEVMSGPRSHTGSNASSDAELEEMLTQVMHTDHSVEDALGLCVASAPLADRDWRKADDFVSSGVLGDRKTVP